MYDGTFSHLVMYEKGENKDYKFSLSNIEDLIYNGESELAIKYIDSIVQTTLTFNNYQKNNFVSDYFYELSFFK